MRNYTGVYGIRGIVLDFKTICYLFSVHFIYTEGHFTLGLFHYLFLKCMKSELLAH